MAGMVATGCFFLDRILRCIQSVITLGRREPRRSLEAFVAAESPIALRKLLCNIGSTGCAVAGANPGIVVASPSKHDPDCPFSSDY